MSFLIKTGVRLHDPILNAIELASEQLQFTLVVTSGTDGTHSGPNDPHHAGRAYDVRSHDAPGGTLEAVLHALNDGELTAQDGGYVTAHFFGWLEAAGTANEHFHFQVRHGVELP